MANTELFFQHFGLELFGTMLLIILGNGVVANILCKVKMQIGHLTLINLIIYLLLKNAILFWKNNFFKYKLIFQHAKKETLLQIYNSYLKKLNINIL